jgi:hypothetical protein
MKVLISLLLVVVLVCPALAAISVKGGLAGGTFRIAGVMDRQVRDNIDIVGDLGYGFGNSYSVISLGAAAIMLVRNNIYAGLGLNYSVYSDPVDLPVGGRISEKSGLGLGLFLGLNLREGMFLQAGYDTRLGGIVEGGYQIRK